MRAAAAVILGRTAGATLRRLRLGGGTSLPGLIATTIDPDLASYLGAQLRHGSAVVTGTNGKTTTSGLLAAVLRDAGLRVWHNREGANLLRGITASLMMRAGSTGRLRARGAAVAVFEVDEEAFGLVVPRLHPRVIVVNNLFRDQLDRYGEVDLVAERWRTILANVPTSTVLALNADDPTVAALADGLPLEAVYFGVEDPGASTPSRDASGEVIDTRTCPRCHATLEYSRRFYSHVGHWSCPACGFARPQPAFRALAVEARDLDAMSFRLETPEGAATVTLGLPGLYNVYNALAAAAAGARMGATLDATRTAIERFTPVFGRAERISVDGREVRILLAKNPTGLNEVLRALAGGSLTGDAPVTRHLLLMLNDRAADGEDVSWIWDADYERVAGLARSLVVSGNRAPDLAVRMKYAGVLGAPVPIGAAAGPGAGSNGASANGGPTAGDLPITVEPRVGPALDAALANVAAGETLYVVPTYTAMLAIRGELERRGYAPRYWENLDR